MPAVNHLAGIFLHLNKHSSLYSVIYYFTCFILVAAEVVQQGSGCKVERRHSITVCESPTPSSSSPPPDEPQASLPAYVNATASLQASLLNSVSYTRIILAISS